jgi:hypothetical protein
MLREDFGEGKTLEREETSREKFLPSPNLSHLQELSSQNHPEATRFCLGCFGVVFNNRSF